MLIEAMQKTITVSYTLGIAGLFVDDKHEQAKAYYKQFDVISLPEQLDNLFLPLSTIAKIFGTRNEPE